MKSKDKPCTLHNLIFVITGGYIPKPHDRVYNQPQQIDSVCKTIIVGLVICNVLTDKTDRFD